MKIDNEIVWVEFTYEYLPIFCFYYGCLGHLEKSRNKKMGDSQCAQVNEGQYRDWLRAKVSREGGRGESTLKKKKTKLRISKEFAEGDGESEEELREIERMAGMKYKKRP